MKFISRVGQLLLSMLTAITECLLGRPSTSWMKKPLEPWPRVQASAAGGTNARTDWWRFVKNEATDEGGTSTADLLVYGEIGDPSWWNEDLIGPKDFAAQLADLGDVSEIRVRINSPGGDVFAAQAIVNLLRTHKAKVVTQIDGLAASAASVIAMAGDEVIMPGNAMMMIHNPWTYAMGDARDLRKTADTLDQVRETIISAYQAKSGMERNAIINLLNAETWMTADQAKSYGLVDTVTDSVKVSASIKPTSFIVNGQEMDFSKFKVWPGALLASALIENSAEGEAGGEAAEGTTEPASTEAGVTEGQAASTETPPAAEEPEASTEEPIQAALAAERKRLQALDDLAAGVQGAEQLLFRAKYEEPMTPEAFAMQLLKSPDVQNNALLQARRNAAQSAAVPSASLGMSDQGTSEDVMAKAIADQIISMRGGTKN